MYSNSYKDKKYCPIDRFLYFFSFINCGKYFFHKFNGIFSLCTELIWFFSVCFLGNSILQFLHLNGFFPLWTEKICSFSSNFLLKISSQTWHLNFFPLCTFIAWLFNAFCPAKVLSQIDVLLSKKCLAAEWNFFWH